MTLDVIDYVLIASTLLMGVGALLTRRYLRSQYVLRPVAEVLLFLTNPYGCFLLIRYLLRPRG